MEKLKPCPFCGGVATFVGSSGVDLMTQNNNPYIGCKLCHYGIHAEAHRGGLKELIEKWNLRAEVKDGK
jgi:Lar family restriction alleviation protein